MFFLKYTFLKYCACLKMNYFKINIQVPLPVYSLGRDKPYTRVVSNNNTRFIIFTLLLLERFRGHHAYSSSAISGIKKLKIKYKVNIRK